MSRFIKRLYVNPLILILSISLIILSFISFYFNFKSLKYILNQDIPVLPSSFDKNALMSAVGKFTPKQENVKKEQVSSNMFVLAIAYSQNPAYSMVLVSSSCGKKVLMVGDSFCGFTVEEIKPFYIIASKDGKSLTLKLSKGQMQGSNTPSNTPAGLPSLKELLKGSDNTNAHTIQRNKLLEITSNPYKMFSDIDLVPTPKGFMFKSVKPGSLFYEMGIRPGDVLVSINNQTLSSPEDAFRILGTLRNSDSFSVKILRDGKPMTLNYNVD